MPLYDRGISTIIEGEVRTYVMGPRQYHPPVDVGQIEVSPDPLPNAAELLAEQEALFAEQGEILPSAPSTGAEPPG